MHHFGSTNYLVWTFFHRADEEPEDITWVSSDVSTHQAQVVREYVSGVIIGGCVEGRPEPSGSSNLQVFKPFQHAQAPRVESRNLG
ncbi:MAG: hypothetical protein Ct9H300mP25_15320 [Acidobacteriota bacterium]|nr:MAG: hypothetical protein Ct9H300mP25_15320 [Acidobacteriota bacterium]